MDYKQKYEWVRTGLTVTMLAFIASIILHINYVENHSCKIPNQVVESDTVKLVTFSEEQLLNYMLLLEIEHIDVVLAQARHETGNYTSNRFIKHNALFGFQTSDTNVIKYKSWKESVIAYKAWQMKRLRPNENYYDFLVRAKYSEDPSYIDKLKQY